MPRVISKETQKSVTGIKITSLNLTRSLLSTVDDSKKYTIQKVLEENLFNKPIVNTEVERGLNIRSFNSKVDMLKSLNRVSFEKLFSMNGINISGGDTGPGELLLYFLIDECYFNRSTNIDVRIGNQAYEVKGARISAAGEYVDLTTGNITSPELLKITKDLIELNSSVNKSTNVSTVEASDIKKLKEKAKDEFNNIEKRYQDEICKLYFKNKKFIFFNNNTGSNRGHIFYEGEIGCDMIGIYRLSRGLRPVIRFK